MLSVLWQNSMTCVVQCTTHTPHMTYCAAIALTSTRCLHQHWTNLVILAKHWLWLPDDGFPVNRNMLEQFYLFWNISISLRFFNVVCISWKLKCWIFLKQLDVRSACSIQHVSFFSAISVRNISRSDKYLASYAPDACRKETCGYVSLLDVSVILWPRQSKAVLCVFATNLSLIS